MASWDETNPDDGDIVSQYPANERAARAAVKTNFGVDHHETDDGDVGKHEVIQVMDNAADPTIASGQVGIWNNGGELRTRSAGGAVSALGFPAGTKMIFYQASAPAGWTQDAAVNDRVLKVVSGTGGGTGGSWTISGVTVDNHTLTVSQMPSHNHGGASGSTAPETNITGSHSHGGSIGNDTHDHNGGTVNTSDDGTTSTADVRMRAGSTTTARFDSALNGFPAYTHSHSLDITLAGTHSHTVDSHTHSISSQGGGTGHNHGLTADGTWRPSHIDVIVATKD